MNNDELIRKSFATGDVRRAMRLAARHPSQFVERTLSGAQRSLLNLERINLARQQALIRPVRSREIVDIWWSQPQHFAIERDDQQQHWHSGHASAVLSAGSIAIVGAQTGGVWIVNPLYGTIPITANYEAIPLSDDWDNPDVLSMAYASGGTTSFYVGCAGDPGALYYVSLEVALGALKPLSQTPLISMTAMGAIWSILVLAAAQRIVLATDRGIWWSDIPPDPAAGSQYAWERADGVAATRFSSLAEGPDSSVIAGSHPEVPSTEPCGVFRGEWADGNLTFVAGTITNAGSKQMRRTSVSSCAANRQVAYAVSAGDDEQIYAVLRTVDGGGSWETRTIPADHGNLGWYNNCIEVAHDNPDRVVLGWRNSGHFFSEDGGQNWVRPNDDGTTLDLHSDVHTLKFVAAETVGAELFAGSDGGVVRTNDLGKTYDSRYNKHLCTLQFYRDKFAASSRFPGLVAGGTQDNGNLYCYLGWNRASWKLLEGGDGDVNRFIDELGALVRFNNTLVVNRMEVGNRARIAFWKEDIQQFEQGLGTVIPVDGNPGGLQAPVLEEVKRPGWSKGGRKLYAVAAGENSSRLHGLFADADGGNASFDFLIDANSHIKALASMDGRTVHIATADGRLLVLDSASGRLSNGLATPLGGGDFARRLEVTASRRAFALLENNGRLLHYDGSNWNDTGTTGLEVFAADPRAGSTRIFAATDADVLVSRDDGRTWVNASLGLPARPHCRDLRIAENGRGGHDLYLATYGRSIYRVTIDFIDVDLPNLDRHHEIVGRLVGGVTVGGGGFIWINGQLIRVPPRGPLMDLLRGIAVIDLAGQMSQEQGTAIRTAAYRAIEEIGKREGGKGRR
jgi:hypothetical protein